jgi:hypothetical protein
MGMGMYNHKVNTESLALPAMLWLLHCDLKLSGGAVPGAAEEQSGDVLMASDGMELG